MRQSRRGRRRRPSPRLPTAVAGKERGDREESARRPAPSHPVLSCWPISCTRREGRAGGARLLGLPREVLLQLLAFLRAWDLAALGMTCSTLADLQGPLHEVGGWGGCGVVLGCVACVGVGMIWLTDGLAASIVSIRRRVARWSSCAPPSRPSPSPSRAAAATAATAAAPSPRRPPTSSPPPPPRPLP